MGAIDNHLNSALGIVQGAKSKILSQPFSSSGEREPVVLPDGTIVADPSDVHLYNQAYNSTNPISDLVDQREQLREEASKVPPSDRARVSAEIQQLNEQIIGEIQKDYEQRWDTITLEEKKTILQTVHNQIAEEFGMDPVEIQFPDIEDPAGKDIRGSHRHGSDGLPIIGGFIDPFDRSTEIKIDMDNLTSDEYTDLMRTVAHETRHQYQHHLVDHPGERPPNISEDQVNDWDENFDDYTSSKDDFTKYRDQPVESDARDYADDYVDEFYEEEAENYN